MNYFTAIELGLLSAMRRRLPESFLVIEQLDGYTYTDPSLQWVHTKVVDILNSGGIPNVATMRSAAALEATTAYEPLIAAVIDVWKTPPSVAIATDLEVLKDRAAKVHIAKNIDVAVKHIERGETKQAQLALERASESETPDVRARSIADISRVVLHRTAIPTGIKTIDYETDGLRKKELGLIFGTTGLGKSLLAVNFGIGAARFKFKVLHIDSENGEDLVRWRYISRMLGKKTRSLMSNTLAEADDEYVKAWCADNRDRIDNLFRILSIGVDSTKLSEVKAEVGRLKREGFIPDIIIFDSPDHLVFKKTDNSSYDFKELYNQLKGWAQHGDFGLWALTQAGKDAEGKIASTKNLAWGYDKGRIADAVISINPGKDPLTGKILKEENMNGQRSLFVSKSRSSKGRFYIGLETDLSTAWIKDSDWT